MNEKGNDFMTMFEEDENEHRKTINRFSSIDVHASDSFWMQYGNGTKN